jgi:hypothetical protein
MARYRFQKKGAMIHPGLRSNVPMSIFIILTLSLLLARCGAERTMVLAPADTSDRFTEAEIVEDKSTVNVPSEVNSSFQAKLSQLISGQGGFARGPGLKIKYRFIQFNPANYFPYSPKTTAPASSRSTPKPPTSPAASSTTTSTPPPAGCSVQRWPYFSFPDHFY